MTQSFENPPRILLSRALNNNARQEKGPLLEWYSEEGCNTGEPPAISAIIHESLFFIISYNSFRR